MDTVRIYEKYYDVIEIFEFHLLVQEVGGGAVFLIEYQHVGDQSQEQHEEESNIINLKGYKQWARTNTKKNRKAI